IYRENRASVFARAASPPCLRLALAASLGHQLVAGDYLRERRRCVRVSEARSGTWPTPARRGRGVADPRSRFCTRPRATAKLRQCAGGSYLPGFTGETSVPPLWPP